MSKILCAAAFFTAATASLGAQQVYRATDPDISQPEIVQQVRAWYTPDAWREGIEGVVGLEGVVRTDGAIGDVVVTRSLDTEHGLDEQALRAVRQWKFKPGTRDGTPVPVRVDININFTLARGEPR